MNKCPSPLKPVFWGCWLLFVAETYAQQVPVFPVYRSAVAGPSNWSQPASWEMSNNQGQSWMAATESPNAGNSSGIIIKSQHTVIIDESVTIDELVVEPQAVLQRRDGSNPPLITVNNGNGIDVHIQGSLRILNNNSSFDYQQAIQYQAGANILVGTGGIIEVQFSAGSQFWRFATESIQTIEYSHGAVFYWNPVNPSSFSSSNITYFPSTPESVVPVFRINASFSVGASNPTTINGRIEVAAGKTVTWDNAGLKTFRNGIGGAGNLIQGNNSGAWYITGAQSQLSGGTLQLRSDGGGLEIRAGTCTLTGNKTISGGQMQIENGATFDAGIYTLAGSGSMLLKQGATLASAHPDGVNGNVALTGSRVFQTGSHYNFYGSQNQSTGTLMPTDAGTLIMANTGSGSNRRLTISNPGTRVSSLVLQSGLLVPGIGQTVFIKDQGSVSGFGGHLSTEANGEGGTVEFLGAASVSGSPDFYRVAIGNSGAGVHFLQNAPIHSELVMKSGAVVGSHPPMLVTGSVLNYQGGDSVSRGREWSGTAGNAGYPWHVTIQNNTTLLPGIAGAGNWEMGGNLRLGWNGSAGSLYMDNFSQPLVVNGHVYIGEGGTAQCRLGLSAAPGGDLWLSGDLHRYAQNQLIHNGRNVVLRGAGSSGLYAYSRHGSPGNDSLWFYGLTADKSSAGAVIQLHAPVSISGELNLQQGILSTSAAYPLYITNPVAGAVTGGSQLSYISGPLQRNTHMLTAGVYCFPLGSLAHGVYRPLQFTTMHHIHTGSAFRGTYVAGTDATPGKNESSEHFLGTLKGILKDEYWQFDRISGSTTGKLSLYYQDPGGAHAWREGGFGNPVSPCNHCAVAVVKRSSNHGAGNWNFTKESNQFRFTGEEPESRHHRQNGFVATGEISSFSPFTLGFDFDYLLGILPVTWKKLNAVGEPSGGIALYWETNRDQEADSIFIEHSTDGIGFLTIAGLHGHKHSWRFFHETTVSGRHFYRLMLKLRTGERLFSPVISALAAAKKYKAGTEGTVVLRGQMISNLWMPASDNVRISLFDAAGRHMYDRKHPVYAGPNDIPVEIPQPANGWLWLHITTSDGKRRLLRCLTSGQ